MIGLWLGAACFFSFAVAPGAFAVLPTREAAGLIVARTLAIVNFSGIAIGVLLFLTTLFKRSDIKSFWIWIERILVVVMVGACGVAQFLIGWWLAVLRLQMGKPIDEVPLEDPLRIQFNQLHQYSVWLLITAMIAALLIFFIISFRTGGKTNAKKSSGFDFQSDLIN